MTSIEQMLSNAARRGLRFECRHRRACAPSGRAGGAWGPWQSFDGEIPRLGPADRFELRALDVLMERSETHAEIREGVMS